MYKQITRQEHSPGDLVKHEVYKNGELHYYWIVKDVEVLEEGKFVYTLQHFANPRWLERATEAELNSKLFKKNERKTNT